MRHFLVKKQTIHLFYISIFFKLDIFLHKKIEEKHVSSQTKYYSLYEIFQFLNNYCAKIMCSKSWKCRTSHSFWCFSRRIFSKKWKSAFGTLDFFILNGLSQFTTNMQFFYGCDQIRGNQAEKCGENKKNVEYCDAAETCPNMRENSGRIISESWLKICVQLTAYLANPP